MMSTATIHRDHALLPTLVHTLRARWAVEVSAVALGITLVAVLAKVSLFAGPVPISGQTLGVLLVGAAYGAKRGAVTMTSYAVVGLLGAPVFAGPVAGPGYVLAPSFGFVLSFIPCAWLVGRLADRGWDRSVWRGLGAAAIASVVPFVVGVPYMVAVLSLTGATPTFAQAMEWGVLPFIPGGIVKAVIAAAVLPGAWWVYRRVNRNVGSDR